MQLIYTNDGLIGIKRTIRGKKETMWVDSVEHAVTVADMHYRYTQGEGIITKDELRKEIQYGIDFMAKHKHTKAEYGAFGTFMWSEAEDEGLKF